MKCSLFRVLLHGDRAIVDLRTLLNIDSVTWIDILSEFTVFKKTKKMGTLLKSLYLKVQTYPISIADCERGFSQMN